MTPDTPHPAVALGGVCYGIRGARLLDGIDVAFARGRFAVVLGPNGAGKSTLLRVATGLARPAAGTVTYGGRAISTFTPIELARMRAVLSQHVELAFPLPAADVVMMGRYPHFGQVPTARDRAIVDDALALVGLAARRGQPYGTLSGGERQKAHLARVLAQLWPADAPNIAKASDTAPALRVLFLDEPTASLDVHYQLAVLDLARAFVADGGTVVAVLHDLNVALRYADHMVLLDGGGVVYDGDPARVPQDALERVFRVRMRAVRDGDGVLWRFTRADGGARDDTAASGSGGRGRP